MNNRRWGDDITEDMNFSFNGMPLEKRISYVFIAVIILINTIIYFFIKPDSDIFGISAYSVIVKGEYYRLISYMFLHNGVEHLLMNMFCLAAVGHYLLQNTPPQKPYVYTIGKISVKLGVKKRGRPGISPLKMAVTYFTGGIAGAVLSMLSSIFILKDAARVTIGASAAVYALLGGAFRKEFKKRKHIIYLIIGALLILSAGAGENVDIAAHAGGFLLGFLITK